MDSSIPAATLASVWTFAVWATVQQVARRLRRPPMPAPTPLHWPALVIACPLAGGDAADGFATCSGKGLVYPGPIRWVFLAADDDRAAGLRAQNHAHALRARGVLAQVVRTRAHGRNHKAAQLAELPTQSRETIVLCLDSDVAPGSVDARGLVALLQNDLNVAVAWQPTVPDPQIHSWGDRLTVAVLAGGAHALPLLAVLDGHSPVGKVLAYAPAAVAHAGGWSAVVGELGEDVAMGHRLAAAGYEVVALASKPAVTVRKRQPVAAVWRRLGRWLQVVRGQRPGRLLAYPLYVAHLIPLLTLWALAAWLGAPPGWVSSGCGVAVLSRLRLAFLARRASGRALSCGQILGDIVLGDVALLLLAGGAVRQRAVWWNGRRLTVELRHAPCAAQAATPAPRASWA